MNTNIARVMLILVLGAFSPEPVRGDAASLLDILPPQTRVVTAADSFPSAMEYHESSASSEPPSSDWRELFGLDPKQLAEVATGALIRAEIALEDYSPAHVVIATVADEKVAIQFLQSLADQRQASSGTRPRTVELGTTQAFLHESSSHRTIVHFVCKGHLVLADTLSVAGDIAHRIAETPADALGEAAAWKAIRAKLTPSTEQQQVHLCWYVNPWLFDEPGKPVEDTSEPSGPSQANAGRHGLTDILAIGGSVVVLDDGSVESHTVIHAPPPFHRTFQMLQLSPAKSLTLGAWIPNDVSSATLLHANVPGAFQHVGLLFDDLFADGIEGTYQDLLFDVKDPDGLNVDIDKDLFAHLGPRVLIVSGRTTPHSDASSPPLLFAFETSAPKLVAKTLDLLMQDDQDAFKALIEGSSVWQIAAEDGAPTSALTVARGYAIYATDVRLLQELLKQDARETLAEDPEIAAARQRILAVDKRPPCLLMARGTASSGGRANGGAGAAWRFPLRFLFEGSRIPRPWDETAESEWWLWDDMTLFEAQRFALGFVEEDGWSLRSVSLPPEAK